MKGGCYVEHPLRCRTLMGSKTAIMWPPLVLTKCWRGSYFVHPRRHVAPPDPTGVRKSLMWVPPVLTKCEQGEHFMQIAVNNVFYEVDDTPKAISLPMVCNSYGIIYFTIGSRTLVGVRRPSLAPQSGG